MNRPSENDLAGVRFVRATPPDAMELIEVQNLSFQSDFERFGECPSYQERPEDMVDMIRHAIVYMIIAGDRLKPM